MIRLLGRRIFWIPCALVALLSVVAPAQSRPWSRNAVNLAQDYLIINDNKGHGDVVVVIWIAPPLIPNEPTNQAARDMLDKYVIVGVVHGHASKEGTFTFDQITELEAADETGQSLKALSVDTMPPVVTGSLAMVQSIFTRSLGSMGQGVHWFAFEGGGTHACAKGGMVVSYGGEKYTYDTPIPGCP